MTWAEGALMRADPTMQKLIETAGPRKLRADPDAWEVLCSTIAFQQVSGKTAHAVCERIRTRHDGHMPRPDEWPTIPRGALHSFGLPNAREDTMRLLARDVERGALNLDFAGKHEKVVRSVLTYYKGVGDWTVDMFLVFHRADPDVFLSGDLGLREAIRAHYAPGAPLGPADAARIAERWKPFRTTACLYLWANVPCFPTPGVTRVNQGLADAPAQLAPR